jgi:hypothetical protein
MTQSADYIPFNVLHNNLVLGQLLCTVLKYRTTKLHNDEIFASSQYRINRITPNPQALGISYIGLRWLTMLVAGPQALGLLFDVHRSTGIITKDAIP